MHVLAIKNNCAAMKTATEMTTATASTLQKQQRQRQKLDDDDDNDDFVVDDVLSDANDEAVTAVAATTVATTTTTKSQTAAATASTETEQFNNNYRQCKKYNDDNNNNNRLLTTKTATTHANTIEKTLPTSSSSTSTNTKTKTSKTNKSSSNTTTTIITTSNWWHRRSRSRQGQKNGSARCAIGAGSLSPTSPSPTLLSSSLSLTMRTTKANNDNCKYSYNFNKINNKLWLITCMLLIMLTLTTTICQIEATLFRSVVAAAATVPAASASTTTTTRTISSTSMLGNSGSTGNSNSFGSSSSSNNYMGAANSPLSALLKSGGATYIKKAAAVAPTTTMQQRQLQQQQLFAMLAKNALSGGSASNGGGVSAAAAAAALNVGATSGRHFLMLNADEDAVDGGDGDDDADDDDDNNNNNNHNHNGNIDVDNDNMSGRDFGGYENFAALRVPTELRNVRRQQRLDNSLAVPPPIAVASLETTGFVADDGQQYEKAVKVLTAATPNTQLYGNGNNNNNHCPKECKCLNVYFDCGKLHLDRVPTLPTYVQTLDLVGNKLNDTTVLEIKNLPELHKLSLKRNQLDVLPKFIGLTMLKQLNLAGNRIQDISSDALAALPKLKSLDLSRNHLHAVESSWFPTSNRLAHLTLNHNMISSVAENAFESLDLVELELNFNRLLNLPGGVFKNQAKLKKLSLNNNHLEINWSTFRGLLSLQKLFLQSNNIRALQDGVFHVMRNIETIELDHNRISSLSRQGLFNLTKLHTLRLSNNSISRIELDTWEFTQSLETLDLSYNNISEFKPQHLDCLQRLKSLNLGHNKIQYLMDNTFDCVKNLEDLNLRRNRLAWVIEDPNATPPFKALRKLKKLDLYGNNLKQINSKSLNGLANLELLNLGANALATIQTGAFDHMPRLQKLIFKSLNFICDCELIWFRNFLQTRFADNASMPANVVCGYPEHMLDRTLDQLNRADLQCIDSPKPVLQQEPTNLLAVKGANITMECIAQSPAAATLAATDELKIKWRHDNQNVRERSTTATSQGAYSIADTQIRHDQSTNLTTIIGYLHLYNVSYESAGRYQCVVSNAFGTTYSQSFKISIGIRPTFLEKPSNLTIDAGETARLVCSATGDPIPEIALQKFGATDFPAATERRLQVRRDENAFLITNAKPSDTGIYTCTAESAAGEIKINATLVVNDKPLPAIPIVHKESDIGATTVLDCLNEEMTADLLQPQREWFKENKPLHISATSHSERYYFTTDKELLIIINTQYHDAGHFRCEITDNLKTLTLQTELAVKREDTNDYFMLLLFFIALALFMVSILLLICLRLTKRRKPKASVLVVSQHERSMNGSLSRMMSGATSQHNMLSGSRGSALDQTQLTTLNRTYLRPAQPPQQQQHQQLQQQQQSIHQMEESPQHYVRPRSLADLDLNPESSNSRLVVTPTTNYHQDRLTDADVLTLTYLQRNEKEHQQDHLSSKDSGTGSDAAVKRSIEDFAQVALLPAASTPTTTLQRIVDGRPLYEYVREEDDDGDCEGDEDNENDLQFAPTRALGVSVYDDMELCELNRNANAEHERFLQNNNHNYSGGGGGGVDADDSVGSAGSGGRRNILPRKCSSQMNGSSTNYNVSPTSTTVDI